MNSPLSLPYWNCSKSLAALLLCQQITPPRAGHHRTEIRSWCGRSPSTNCPPCIRHKSGWDSKRLSSSNAPAICGIKPLMKFSFILARLYPFKRRNSGYRSNVPVKHEEFSPSRECSSDMEKVQGHKHWRTIAIASAKVGNGLMSHAPPVALITFVDLVNGEPAESPVRTIPIGFAQRPSDRHVCPLPLCLNTPPALNRIVQTH